MQRERSQERYLSNKKHWIPPPGRASRNTGKRKTSTVIENQNQSNPSSTSDVQSQNLPSSVDMYVGNSPSLSPSSRHTNDSAPDSSSATLSLVMIPGNGGQDSEEDKLVGELQKMRNVMQFIRPICTSIQETLQVLHRPIFISATDELAVKQMVAIAERHMQELLDCFDEFEGRCSTSELASRNNSSELPIHLQKCSDTKEHLFMKLVQVYDHVTSTLKFIIQLSEQDNIAAFRSDYEELGKKVQALEEYFLTREGELQRLQEELTISEEQVRTLQILKETLERKQRSSEEELNRQISQVKSLESQLYRARLEKNGIAENERLIEVMEDVKEHAESEKNALKKALKIQKLRADQRGSVITQLEEKIDQQKQQILGLASDQDQWKIKITSMSNKLTEEQSKNEFLKTNNLDLKAKLGDLESNAESKAVENSNLITTLSEENEKLKEAIKAVEEKFFRSEGKIQALQQKNAELETRLEEQIKTTAKVKENSYADLNAIMPVLQELKDSLCIIKENSLHVSNRLSKNIEAKNSLNENNLFDLVKEIKHLIETKEVHQFSVEENKRNLHTASIEDRLQKLQEKYDQECAEKQKLLEKLEEKLSHTRTKHPEVESQFLDIEEQRLMDVENRMKMRNLDEELRYTKQSLMSIEKQKKEAISKLQAQVKELQNELSRTTMNYESLQKYVNVLKASYTNVFGIS